MLAVMFAGVVSLRFCDVMLLWMLADYFTSTDCNVPSAGLNRLTAGESGMLVKSVVVGASVTVCSGASTGAGSELVCTGRLVFGRLRWSTSRMWPMCSRCIVAARAT
jgi:hypothetical protein